MPVFTAIRIHGFGNLALYTSKRFDSSRPQDSSVSDSLRSCSDPYRLAPIVRRFYTSGVSETSGAKRKLRHIHRARTLPLRCCAQMPPDSVITGSTLPASVVLDRHGIRIGKSELLVAGIGTRHSSLLRTHVYFVWKVEGHGKGGAVSLALPSPRLDLHAYLCVPLANSMETLASCLPPLRLILVLAALPFATLRCLLSSRSLRCQFSVVRYVVPEFLCPRAVTH